MVDSIQTLLVVGDAVMKPPLYLLLYHQKVEAADAEDIEPVKARRKAAIPMTKTEDFHRERIFMPVNLLITRQAISVRTVTAR